MAQDGAPFRVGKLPSQFLAEMLSRYTILDPRVVVGPRIGEDVAAIDFGDRYLLAKTDPITFVAEDIGYYAINVNANDIACAGGLPKWFLATILLPENATDERLVSTIFSQLYRACRKLRVSFCGGHTEVTYGLDRPIVVGTMLGEVDKDKLVTTSGARVGDELILTKGIAIEAASIIAREKEEHLKNVFSPEVVQRAQHFLHDPGISVLRDAQVAVAAGEVHAMHDPTEGGLATGLHELAEAAGVGIRVHFERIPMLPEAKLLCEEFGLDPLGAIASGALLIAAPPSSVPAIVRALQQEGIRAAVIGEVVAPEHGVQITYRDTSMPLPRFDQDEITKIFRGADGDENAPTEPE
ncbi:MAG: AIR synthase family protein [candidate division KSB1 bacterium]|nr:AIR synthase family protein [candidate division KSB1 bacterium]